MDLLYQIGLTLVKGIGNITAKMIIENLGSASLLFSEKPRILELIPGISRKLIAEIRNPVVLKRAEQEVEFIRKNKIIPLFIRDDDYPQRLKDCVDAPVMLFYRGEVSLNAKKIVAVVGTRNASAYGKETTAALLAGFAEKYPDIVIVSGLAYGIDVSSHRAALRENLPTVGVLAHGLDRIYPPAHLQIAVNMLEKGGVLTEFLSKTNPDRPNFVKRNRIVAGLADCVIVVESAAKGGALITANIGASYNRDVFAVPGRANDVYSQGCNNLIKSRRAALITCAEDVFREMCWLENQPVKKQEPMQQNLFEDLNPDEKRIVGLLSKTDNMQLNILCIEMDMPINQLSSLLFELEMKGIVRCMPGGLYKVWKN